MEYGIWNTEYGIRNMEYGIWNTEYGIRNMEYGIWDTEYGIWNKEYLTLTLDCRLVLLLARDLLNR